MLLLTPLILVQFELEFRQMNPLSPIQFDPCFDPSTTPSLQTSNIEFIDRLCLHIQQLCLTKTSLLTISQISQKYKHRVTQNLSSKSIFTQFFEEVYQFCNQIILRLKKLDDKKFQPLIKRKLTDIFGCVMRYSYDLKLIAVADKANEMKRLVKVDTSFSSLSWIVLGHDNVREGFLRLKEKYYSHLHQQAQRRSRQCNALWKLNLKLKGKQEKQKRYFLNNWYLNVKIRNSLADKTVGEKVIELYTKLMSEIESELETDQRVLSSLREFCRVDRIEYHRYWNGYLVAREEQPQSDRSEGKSWEKVVPEGVYKECIDSQEMATESVSLVTSRLYIPLKHTKVIGLVVITYDNEILDWKEIELLLRYCERISEILERVYSVQSKVEYYTQFDDFSNRTAERLCKKYLEWNPSHLSYKGLFDSVFKDLGFVEMDIGLITNKIEKFYQLPSKESPPDPPCLSMLSYEFRSRSKQFLEIEKEGGMEIIIPLKKEEELVGCIRYLSRTENPSSFIEAVRSFVGAVMMRLKNEEMLSKGTASTRVVSGNGVEVRENIQRGRKILTSESLDQIESIVSTAISEFNSKLYGCIVWRYNHHFFLRSQDSISLISPSHPLYPLFHSDRQSSQSTHPFTSEQSTFIKQFPCFPNSHLYQYSNQHKSVVIQQLRFERFIIVLGYFEGSVGEKEITYASSIDPRIPYDDLMEIGGNVEVRVRKGYLNEDFNGNVFVLEEEMKRIREAMGDEGKGEGGKGVGHGKYLCYQTNSYNLRLLEIHPQYPHYKARMQSLQRLLSTLNLKEQQVLEENKATLRLKQSLLTLNSQIVLKQKQSLREVVSKFQCKRADQRGKRIRMEEILSNSQWARKGLVQSFRCFVMESELAEVVRGKRDKDMVCLVNKLKDIFQSRVINTIRQELTHNQHQKQAKAQAILSLLRLRASNKNTLTQTALSLLESNANKYRQSIHNTLSSKLLSVSLLLRNKLISHQSQFFVSLTHQMVELSESISTIIEEISLLRMISYTTLLSFVCSRLSLHTDRLFNNKSSQVSFRVLQLKESDIKSNTFYSSMKNNEKTIVTNIQGRQYLIADIQHLPLEPALVNQISRLLSALKEALLLIRENTRRKLGLLIRVISSVEKNNLSKGLASLYSNLATLYKDDLHRSLTTLKDSQESLALVQSSQDSEKENTQIHNTIKDMKGSLGESNKAIYNLKLENKIRKKTFSASILQSRDLVRQKTQGDLRQAFQKINLYSQERARVALRDMDLKLIKSGIRSLGRFCNSKAQVNLKQGFNNLINSEF